LATIARLHLQANVGGNSIHIGLVGNPNSGKSSLFNCLTGLNQKVGNFPGVTVELKVGVAKIDDNLHAEILDLPGTYSLYPRRQDEWVTYDLLINEEHEEHPDILVVIADASNLKRNLLFASQIIDLKIPMVIVITMMDLARKKGVEIDVEGLERELGVKIIFMGFGLDNDNLHSPNEKYDIFNFYKGIETIPYFHKYLAEGESH
jgi:ferrous iron transport protein B